MSIRELKEKALKGGEGDQRRFAWELLGAENYVDSLYWYCLLYTSPSPRD